jgi:hypothetical protein
MAAATCGDLQTDAKNCGKCGNDCSAANASVMCVSAQCRRTCAADHADCNKDLDRGGDGDGCEVNLSEDASSCGACGASCREAAGTVATCSAAKCMSYGVSVSSAPFPGDVSHGGKGGSPFQRECAAGELVVGIDAVSDADAVYGFSVLCSRVALTKTSTTPGKAKLPEELGLSTPEPHALPLIGCAGPNSPGAIPPACLRPADAEPTTTRLRCPEGAVVAAVGGAITTYNGTTLGLKQLLLTCARAVPDAQRQIIFMPQSTLEVGTNASATEKFQTSCPKGAAVLGFSGGAGAFIDGISHSCTTLSLDYVPSEKAL